MGIDAFQGSKTTSKHLALEALNIRRRLVQADAEAWQVDLAMSLGTCMNSFVAAGRFDEARKAGAEALLLFTALADRWPAG